MSVKNNIRKRIESKELELSPYAQRSADSAGRKRSASDHRILTRRPQPGAEEERYQMQRRRQLPYPEADFCD